MPPLPMGSWTSYRPKRMLRRVWQRRGTWGRRSDMSFLEERAPLEDAVLAWLLQDRGALAARVVVELRLDAARQPWTRLLALAKARGVDPSLADRLAAESRERVRPCPRCSQHFVSEAGAASVQCPGCSTD